MNTAATIKHKINKDYEITVKFYIKTKNNVSRLDAEYALCELIDHSMLYSIGKDYVSDDGHPIICDYELDSDDRQR